MERPEPMAAAFLVEQAEHGLRRPLVGQLRRSRVAALALRGGGLAGQDGEGDQSNEERTKGAAKRSRHMGVIVPTTLVVKRIRCRWTGVRSGPFRRGSQGSNLESPVLETGALSNLATAPRGRGSYRSGRGRMHVWS